MVAKINVAWEQQMLFEQQINFRQLNLIKKNKADALLLFQKSQTYNQRLVCLAHKAVIKRTNKVFETTLVDGSQLFKKNDGVFWKVKTVSRKRNMRWQFGF